MAIALLISRLFVTVKLLLTSTAGQGIRKDPLSPLEKQGGARLPCRKMVAYDPSW